MYETYELVNKLLIYQLSMYLCKLSLMKKINSKTAFVFWQLKTARITVAMNELLCLKNAGA